MLSQNQQKLIRSLSVKKYRIAHRLFVVEGEKMVLELLAQTQWPVKALYGLGAWLERHEALWTGRVETVHEVADFELKKISSLTTPHAVLALAALPPDTPSKLWPLQQWCFYLDGIQDPGNLGAILRVADWFGWPAVYCSPETVDVYNPKVVQASMGAVFRVNCWELPLPALLSHTPGIEVAGAVLNGEDVFEAPLPSAGLLVIGNEGRGISQQTEALLTRRLTIPRGAVGAAESLNASVAAGILAAFCARGR